MELSATTIGHLRDEAYATLCRHAVTQALEQLEQEKANIVSTRPPFGILASKQTREAFERSLQTATGNEAGLRTRLGQIIQLEKWLHGILHTELRQYLSLISPEYRHFAQVDQMLDQWEVQFRALPELLTAFARDVKNATLQSASAPGMRDLQLFAILRDSALRVEQHFNSMDQIVTQFTLLLPSDATAEVRVPKLPDFRRVAWVNRIAALPADQLLTEGTRVEREAREFVAADHASIGIRLQAAHEACKRYEENFLLHYWNQLRAHAQAHYIEERNIDEVIEMLMQNYVTSDLARRQRELIAADPFQGER